MGSNNLLGIPKRSNIQSYIRLSTPSGHSSSNACNRTFTVIEESKGYDVIYYPDTVRGDYLQVTADGVYAIVYTDGRSAAGANFGLVRNLLPGDFNASISTVTASTRLAWVQPSAGTVTPAVAIVPLITGDKIYPIDDSNCNVTGATITLSISRVS